LENPLTLELFKAQLRALTAQAETSTDPDIKQATMALQTLELALAGQHGQLHRLFEVSFSLHALYSSELATGKTIFDTRTH
jgi:hypothetical protein